MIGSLLTLADRRSRRDALEMDLAPASFIISVCYLIPTLYTVYVSFAVLLFSLRLALGDFESHTHHLSLSLFLSHSTACVPLLKYYSSDGMCINCLQWLLQN